MKDPYLKNLPVFEGLSCDQARKLGHMVVDRTFPPGSPIFTAREKAEYVYLIRQGQVKLFRQGEDGRENIIAILGPGDVFGEFVLFERTCHSVHATAFEAAVVCILPRRNFLRLLADEPAIALTIIHNIGQRLARNADVIENLSTYDPALRLARLLLRLAEEHESGQGGVRIPIRLTHQDLANMIAASRQTVTVLINRFKQDGAVRYDGRHIVVDRAALTALAQGH